MTEQLVAVERRDGLTALTVNRPDKRNALSREVLDELRDALVEAASDETLRVLTITGAGRDNFTSGGDLVALSAVRTPADAAAMARHARTVLDHIRTFPVPVVAAVNGDALGGGPSWRWPATSGSSPPTPGSDSSRVARRSRRRGAVAST